MQRKYNNNNKRNGWQIATQFVLAVPPFSFNCCIIVRLVSAESFHCFCDHELKIEPYLYWMFVDYKWEKTMSCLKTEILSKLISLITFTNDTLNL